MGVIIGLTIGFLFAMVFDIVLNKMGKVYVNKGWVDKNTLNIDIPRFKVESVKRTVGCNGEWVAEYKATCWYRTKEDVDYQSIIFYDEIGKYNIDDELELTKV